MTIREELAAEIRDALKAGQKERLRVLRQLKAEFEVAETSGGDFDEVRVVKAYAKSLRKTAEQYEELGKDEQAESCRHDLSIVEEFLPPQMGREELEPLITDLIEQNDYGPRDIGKVMKTVMSEHGDAVDGRLAQQIAREKLAEGG